MRVIEGDASLPAESKREAELKARNRIDADLRLSCIIRLRTDLTVTAPYW